MSGRSDLRFEILTCSLKKRTALNESLLIRVGHGETFLQERIVSNIRASMNLGVVHASRESSAADARRSPESNSPRRHLADIDTCTEPRRRQVQAGDLALQ